MLVAVQWFRHRFNDCFDKAEWTKSRAPEEMPESASYVEKLIYDKAIELVSGLHRCLKHLVQDLMLTRLRSLVLRLSLNLSERICSRLRVDMKPPCGCFTPFSTRSCMTDSRSGTLTDTWSRKVREAAAYIKSTTLIEDSMQSSDRSGQGWTRSDERFRKVTNNSTRFNEHYYAHTYRRIASL